jgi:uncharacterized membrane protein
MLEEILTQLRQAQMPSSASVAQWLQLALIKKMGILSLPYQFWPTDIKINPSAKHLLWAAILAEDTKRLALVEGIVHNETAAATPNAGQSGSTKADHLKARKIMRHHISELLAVNPDPIFQKLLTAKVKKSVPPGFLPLDELL